MRPHSRERSSTDLIKCLFALESAYSIYIYSSSVCWLQTRNSQLSASMRKYIAVRYVHFWSAHYLSATHLSPNDSHTSCATHACSPSAEIVRYVCIVFHVFFICPQPIPTNCIMSTYLVTTRLFMTNQYTKQLSPKCVSACFSSTTEKNKLDI